MAAESEIKNIAAFFEIVRNTSRVLINDNGYSFTPYLDALIGAGDNPSLPEPDYDIDAVNILTVHKAKGLEFDWVIIPSMQKTTRANTRPLLNWGEYNSASGRGGFLLAANDHSEVTAPNLYNYLEIQRAKRELEETTRLLYVGATRAVSRLLLTASPTYKEDKEQYTTPPGRSLLGRIFNQMYGLQGWTQMRV